MLSPLICAASPWARTGSQHPCSSCREDWNDQPFPPLRSYHPPAPHSDSHCTLQRLTPEVASPAAHLFRPHCPTTHPGAVDAARRATFIPDSPCMLLLGIAAQRRVHPLCLACQHKQYWAKSEQHLIWRVLTCQTSHVQLCRHQLTTTTITWLAHAT